MLNSAFVDTLQVHKTATYRLDDVEGLGELPEIRVSKYDNPGENGATVGNELYGGRLLSLTGSLEGTDFASFRTARSNLQYACRIQRDTSGLVAPTRLTFTTNDSQSYFVDGYIQPGFKLSIVYLTYAQFRADFYCPDGALYGSTLLTTGLISRQTGGGATFPLTFPVTFTGGSTGTGTITNAGTLDTWPIIYLTGVLTGPRIYAIEQAKGIKLNYTTTDPSDVITIDMKRKTVMLNGTTSLLPYLDDSDRAWFSAPVGVSTYLFTTSSSLDTGTMEVTAYSAFGGI